MVAPADRTLNVRPRVLQQTTTGWFFARRRERRLLARISVQVVKIFRARPEMEHELETLFTNRKHARTEPILGPERIRTIRDRLGYRKLFTVSAFTQLLPQAKPLK